MKKNKMMIMKNNKNQMNNLIKNHRKLKIKKKKYKIMKIIPHNKNQVIYSKQNLVNLVDYFINNKQKFKLMKRKTINKIHYFLVKTILIQPKKRIKNNQKENI